VTAVRATSITTKHVYDSPGGEWKLYSGAAINEDDRHLKFACL